MLRLLIVMAVLMLSVALLVSRDHSGEEAAAPEQIYREQTQKARDLERQMQEQVDRQLEQIDAATPRQ